MIEPKSMSEQHRLQEQVNRLFVYGILKRDKELDLRKEGAKFLGEASINGANLYRIGSGVGLRLVEDPTRVAHGEVFQIDRASMWHWLDQIEANGFCYTRKIVRVECPGNGGKEFDFQDGYMNAWVYEHTYPDFRYNNLIENGVY